MNAFSQALFQAVRRIPKGRVISYGFAAFLAGRPGAARAAGAALRACRDQETPCHRVLFKDGRLSPGYAPNAPDLQKALLLEEGVSFLPDGRVDMAACAWYGED